eukprot:gene6244-biopygen7327
MCEGCDVARLLFWACPSRRCGAAAAPHGSGRAARPPPSQGAARCPPAPARGAARARRASAGRRPGAFCGLRACASGGKPSLRRQFRAVHSKRCEGASGHPQGA